MKNNILEMFFSVIIISLITILVNPEILMASDSVAVTGLDASKIVETVVIEPEVEDTKELTPVETTPVVSAPKAGVVESAPVTQVQPAQAKQEAPVKQEVPVVKSVSVAPANNVKFSWGIQELFRASSTGEDSGANVARVGRLIWGHNYTAFGNITKLGIGSTFTMTENGVTTTYRVVPNPIDGKAGVVLDLKDSVTLSYAGDARYSSIKMNAFTEKGFGGHSLVLLTCYGSNSRYVVVADAM